MSNDSRHDELIDLAFAVCDGTATDDQIATVEELIADDPATRLLYLQCMELHFEMDYRALDSEAADPESPLSLPICELSTTHSPLSTNFVGGPVFSYMVASVVLCMMLLGAWAYKISRVDPSPLIGQAGRSRAIDREFVVVGQVTGMKDCRWVDENEGTMVGAAIYRGRKYAFSSGLMEITYRSGARVILEGPCEYKVDSDAGGYLAVGRLTARIQKRGKSEERRGLAASVAGARPQAANPQSLIPNPQSLIPNPQPLAPTSQSPASLFSVTTPTAVVTDLGTEFGVEVEANGSTASHVFQGSVEVMPIGGNSNDAVLLGKNDSIRVEKAADSGKPVVVRGKNAEPPRFIRAIPQQRRGFIDLADIVAGGDGFGQARGRGIDAVTGRVVDRPPTKYTRHSTGRYQGVEELPLIDGVFIPDGGQGTVQIDSAGHRFSGFTDTSGDSWNYFWSGQLPPSESGKIACWLGNANYASRRHSVLSIPPNKGITFDLEAIRQKHPDLRLVRFTTVAGNTEMRSDNPRSPRVSADLWVFVNGELRFSRTDVNSTDGQFIVEIPLVPATRFLTLAATDAGNGTSFDWTMFGDPRLEIKETIETTHEKESKPMKQ